MKKTFGFFSSLAVEHFGGSHVYQSVEKGKKQVIVTAVFDDPEAPEYRWEDKVCLGRVGKWLRVEVPRKSNRAAIFKRKTA